MTTKSPGDKPPVGATVQIVVARAYYVEDAPYDGLLGRLDGYGKMKTKTGAWPCATVIVSSDGPYEGEEINVSPASVVRPRVKS